MARHEPLRPSIKSAFKSIQRPQSSLSAPCQIGRQIKYLRENDEPNRLVSFVPFVRIPRPLNCSSMIRRLPFRENRGRAASSNSCGHASSAEIAEIHEQIMQMPTSHLTAQNTTQTPVHVTFNRRNETKKWRICPISDNQAKGLSLPMPKQPWNLEFIEWRLLSIQKRE